MSEHNRAIRQAQKLLRAEADRLPDVEIGYHHYAPHPYAGAFEEAADMLEVLVEDAADQLIGGRDE